MMNSLAAIGKVASAVTHPRAGEGIGPTPSDGARQASFAETLSTVIGKTDGDIVQAEQQSLQAMSGDFDTRKVVDAVMKAEQTLQAAIAVRDKIVTAYLEISRMSI